MPTGAALALEPGQVTSHAVRDALTRLLGEPSFRQAARRLRDEIEDMPDADTVLEDLLFDPRTLG